MRTMAFRLCRARLRDDRARWHAVTEIVGPARQGHLWTGAGVMSASPCQGDAAVRETLH